MTAVTICSGFRAQEEEICHYFHFSPFYLAWSYGLEVKGNTKGWSDYRTIALISHANKVMLNILQATFQHYVNWELLDVQAGFRKGKGIRDQIANICWIIEKVREFQKNIYFCSIDYAKTFECVDHNKL